MTSGIPGVEVAGSSGGSVWGAILARSSRSEVNIPRGKWILLAPLPLLEHLEGIRRRQSSMGKYSTRVRVNAR